MKKKVVLIIGATSMIGQTTARLLANRDIQLVLLGRDNKKLKILLNTLNGEGEIFEVDIRSNDQVAEVVKK